MGIHWYGDESDTSTLQRESWQGVLRSHVFDFRSFCILHGAGDLNCIVWVIFFLSSFRFSLFGFSSAAYVECTTQWRGGFWINAGMKRCIYADDWDDLGLEDQPGGNFVFVFGWEFFSATWLQRSMVEVGFSRAWLDRHECCDGAKHVCRIEHLDASPKKVSWLTLFIWYLNFHCGDILTWHDSFHSIPDPYSIHAFMLPWSSCI